MARARHFKDCVVACVVPALACVAWPATGIVADLFFPATPRGVSTYELAAVALSVVVPSLALGKTTQAERLSTERRAVLGVWTAALLVLPMVPFAAWYVRVQYFHDPPEDLESGLPVLANLLIYAVIGLVLVRFCGVITGGIVAVVGFAALVLAQNRWGYDILFGTFSDSVEWTWNPWVTAVVLVASGSLLWRTRGGPVLVSQNGE